MSLSNRGGLRLSLPHYSLAIFAMAMAFALMVAPAQQSAPTPLPWKEYLYPKNGFSVAAPTAPEIHADADAPDVTVYRWQLASGVPFAIHAGVRPNCLKILAIFRKKIPFEKLKDISIGPNPGVEYETADEGAGENHVERLYCAGNTAYTLTAIYPIRQSRPADVDRLFNSFRLLDHSAN